MKERENILLDEEDLQFLVENGVIKSEEANLRSKIESIIRTLENLSQKKLRVEFEIQQQKRALARKRTELKKSKKSSQTKVKLALENKDISHSQGKEDPLRNLDDNLLQRSSHLLQKLSSN